MVEDLKKLKDIEESSHLLADDVRDMLGKEVDELYEDDKLTLESKDLIRHAIAALSAQGKREPTCFITKVVNVLQGESSDKNIYILQGNGDHFYYMDASQAPDTFNVVDPALLIGHKIDVIPIGIFKKEHLTEEETKNMPPIDTFDVQVSYRAIFNFWQNQKNNVKILRGKVMSVRTEGVALSCLGRKVIIPLDQFYGNVSEPFLINKFVRFIVVDVKDVNGITKIYGNQKIVHEYYKVKLHEFYNSGQTFSATINVIDNFGAYLLYKDTVRLILRNKDFSTDFTKVEDIEVIGRKIKVKMLGYGPNNDDVIFVEKADKYVEDNPIDYRNYNIGDVLENMVVRTVSPFAAFIGSRKAGMRGRDIMVPVRDSKREPHVGDIVNVKLKVINSETGDAKGEIVRFADDQSFSLDEFDLI